MKITKKLYSEDKVASSDLSGTFRFEVTLTGDSFWYNDNYYGTDSDLGDTYTFSVTIEVESGSASWTSDVIGWIGDAPSYYIEETYSGTYELMDTSKASGSLEDGSTVTATIKNKEPEPTEKIILTMEIGGTVWNDTDYTDGKEIDTEENGKIDEGEEGIPGVKVTITRVIVSTETINGETYTSGNIVAVLSGVYAYDGEVRSDCETDSDGNSVLVTYTDDNGDWSVDALSVPALSEEDGSLYTEYKKAVSSGRYMVSYNVTFSYDGQTYEPTTFLEYSDGDEDAYKSASNESSGRDNWINDSMAYDDAEERIAFNEKFASIMGLEEMDENGYTTGTTSGGVTLDYSSYTTTNVSGNETKVSELETYNSDGTIKEDLLMEASTSTGGLTYPFDSEIHLTNKDVTIDEYTGGTIIEYTYSATYNYCKNINLGLIEREYADTAVLKNLSSATVVVNGKATTYEYDDTNDILDSQSTDQAVLNELLTQKLEEDSGDSITYTLGLYKSDYYYRASIYESDTELYEALKAYYTGKKFISTSSAIELEVYLTYTITVYNQSETYDIVINEIADYYDETLTLVDTKSDWSNYTEAEGWNEYTYSTDGISYMEDAEGPVQVVDDPSVTYNNSTTTVIWTDPTSAGSSEGINYYKTTTTSLSGITISAGSAAVITTTFRVNDDYTDTSSISELVQLGAKHNVAEVTSFSSYYSSNGPRNGSYKWTDSSYAGAIAGRVDKDSAPDNVPTKYLGTSEWYEDDTNAAPVIKIELNSEEREVSGLAWEDAETEMADYYSQVIGDGTYDETQGDKLISGLTTELVETISIPVGTDSSGNTIYEEFDYIWPTDVAIDDLGGLTIEELTGLDTTTVTSDATEDSDGGEYVFTGITAGNYIVRFVYGDTYIETGNDGYEEVYNGQDYKSTTYQIGIDNDSDDDGYTDNEWHDLENDTDERVSDARDSEARRLVVAAQSEILTYDNTSVLAAADDKTADHTELFGEYDNDDPVNGSGYYMYAETAKLKLQVEDIYDTTYETTTASDGTTIYSVESSDITSSNYSYVIENIDFGLEERSQTQIDLNKQIKEIKLITSDGETILDAIYNITYGDDCFTIEDDGTTTFDPYAVEVTLDESSVGSSQIASLNRASGMQGYRYIMIESSILQGTTIEITYQLTVLNVGEADTCNEILKTVWSEINDNDNYSVYEEALNELTSPFYTASNGRVVCTDSSGNVLTDVTSSMADVSSTKYQYGLYFGSIYYLGKQGSYDDAILVETTVHQILDYVDPDVEFDDEANIVANQSWSKTTIEYLLTNKLIDPAAVIIIDENGDPVINESLEKVYTLADAITYEDDGTYTIRYPDVDGYSSSSGWSYAFLSDEVQQFMVSQGLVTDTTKNNLILSVDDSSDVGNSSLVKATTTYTSDNSLDKFTASITLETTRYYSSEDDGSDIDNIAEIIKVENIVGRRDIRTVSGNAITYQIDWDTVEEITNPDYEDIITETVEPYEVAGEEPDTDSPEEITLTPPTGLNTMFDLVMQVLAIVGCAGVILAIGIVLIKKKVLTK